MRRFNFLRFQDWETPQFKLLRNPEVTVRSRGVMEKCTYCVQRINNVRIDAEKQNRAIRDGEIVTACDRPAPRKRLFSATPTIPTAAWPNSRRSSGITQFLGELNARPRTTYLAAVRNPNPEIGEGMSICNRPSTIRKSAGRIRCSPRVIPTHR